MEVKWKYKGKLLREIPANSEGFIYLITFSDGTKYLGKKSFWSRRRTKVKGKIRKVLKVTESDWRKYRGSSEHSKRKAKEGLVAKLEVIHFCESKGCLMFMELVEMVKRDVLCSEVYLNANIMLRVYKCYKPMEV